MTTSQIYEVGASLPKEAADHTERVLEMQPAREVHVGYGWVAQYAVGEQALALLAYPAGAAWCSISGLGVRPLAETERVYLAAGSSLTAAAWDVGSGGASGRGG